MKKLITTFGCVAIFALNPTSASGANANANANASEPGSQNGQQFCPFYIPGPTGSWPLISCNAQSIQTLD
jgi:hypothetical protein